ncbi:hypothetical protein DP939_20115 [Spongiactinospora rosea]|uniref:GrpB family protein n=1 Tax=Spongiactinospora rosea TaxID=2248750 RepID=A0A366LW81_9ACTN|nr:GrpB family protein [Spongiactinospora rosea]RBQ18205.1 hypothetical protein DP939_20115 [Spongiactinospora rosea]
MSSAQSGTEPAYSSDADVQKYRLGPVVPHNAPVRLDEYDPRWPELFAREAGRVRSVLGATALRVEHVGSTSVPGLCAKPIIDMLLVVPDSADESAYVAPLEAAGYRLWIREAEWLEHRLLKGPDTDINMHVFSEGVGEIDRMLRFRDRLRADEGDRNKYADAKRELARRTWRHVQHYADAKTSVVQDIMERADPAP